MNEIMNRNEILIIESDEMMQKIYQECLSNLGEINVYEDIPQLKMQRGCERLPSMIIADLGNRRQFKPEVVFADLEICSLFHAVPVIFVSVYDQVELIRSIVSTEKGWDFLPKPFNLNLLKSKCHVILDGQKRINPSINTGSMKLVHQNKESEQLTALEIKLLSYLLKQPNATALIDDLATHVWGCKNIDGRIDVNLSRLRKKIAPTGLKLSRNEKLVSLIR